MRPPPSYFAWLGLTPFFFLSMLLVRPASLLAAAPPAKLARVQVQGSKRFSEAQVIRAGGLKVGAPASSKTFKDAAGKLAASGAFSDVSYKVHTVKAGLAVVFRVADATTFYPARFSNFVWFSEKELQEALRARVPLFSGEVPLTGNLPEQIEYALAGLLEARGIHGAVHHSLAGREGGAIMAIQFGVRGVPVLIRQVQFEGASQVDAKALQSAVDPLLGTEYDQQFVRDFAAANISPLYWERGYLEVSYADPAVALLKDTAPGAAVAVTVPVREGAQYRLAEIRWTGNSALSSKELATYIHLRPGEPANAVELGRDLESIREPYAARGYLHAAVVSKPSFQEAAHTVSYELVVSEGDVYRMGTLKILGVDAAHSQALLKNSKLRPGDPFDKSYWSGFISEGIRRLPRHPQGWKIGTLQSIREETKTVDVTISFTPK